MGYSHQLPSPMGTSLDTKFPTHDDYHHHNGYSMTSSLGQNNTDFLHHPNNGLHQNSNNFNYAQGIGGHFYHHHHHGYTSPQIHSSQNNTSYSNSGSYYGGYYGSSGHQIMDLPMQCSTAEPTNTALVLQDLGKFLIGEPSGIHVLFIVGYPIQIHSFICRTGHCGS